MNWTEIGLWAIKLAPAIIPIAYVVAVRRIATKNMAGRRDIGVAEYVED